MKDAYLTYAFNQEGKLVHVDSVPNGDKCGCRCPACGCALRAKNGGDGIKMVHHFAHQPGSDCEGAVESAMHLLAKRILQETKCLFLPGRFDWQSGEVCHFDRVEEESYDKETGLRPDCVGYYGDKILWVEFKYTHAVDEEKKQKIISARIDCVEIDLSNCELDEDALKKFITESAEDRKWIRDANIDRSEAAKEIIYERFHQSRNFTIVVPQKQMCESLSCPFYDRQECYLTCRNPYDLKGYGYVECLKDYTFPDTQFKCDLLIKRKDSFENAIAILIETSEQDEHATLAGKKHIVLRLFNDNSLLELQDGPIEENDSYDVDYFGFKKENHSKEWQLYEAKRNLLRFVLYSNGKYRVDEITCLHREDREWDSVCSIIFEDNMSPYYAIKYGLWTCYKNHRKACYCELCYCLTDDVPIYEPRDRLCICKRYKTKGTPKYPLQTKPTECPHFLLNQELVSDLELELKQIKMVVQEENLIDEMN